VAPATDRDADWHSNSGGNTQVVRKRTLVLCAAAATSVIVPIADALRIAPLRTRDGVVLTWRPQNRVAVVAQRSGKLLAIHSLRRVAPGTRVTVQGIKWGTPVAGIKWGTPGEGIKWGIKWGRNGSYQSPIRSSTKRAVWTPVRGPIVKRFGRKAIALGTRGGIVVVRLPTGRGSEGLPGQHSLNATAVPPVGALVSMRVSFAGHGIRIGRGLRYLKPPIPGAPLPVAGVVVKIDPATRTLVLLDDQDPAYPARFTVVLPAAFTIAPYHVGQSIAAEGLLGAGGTIDATLVGLNGTFSQADDPQATQILTTGNPTCPNSLDAACSLTPPGGPPPSGGAPPPPSGSTPPPPSPPGGPPPVGNPPPDPGVPPPGGNPPPPPDPGVPPPGCLPAAPTAGAAAAARPQCLIDWCREQKALTGRRPPICRRHRGDHQSTSRKHPSHDSNAWRSST
jgi:hypothetical protein